MRVATGGSCGRVEILVIGASRSTDHAPAAERNRLVPQSILRQALRPRDPPDRVHQERDRVRQPEDPQSRPRAWALPDRASRTQVRLPCRDGPRPHRQGQSLLDPALEASPQRIRHPIRRLTQRRPSLKPQPSYTVRSTGPRRHWRLFWVV